MPSQHDLRAGRRRTAIPVRRKWGQHFLVGADVAERIVEAAGVGPEDSVIEVGPGQGALTRPLAGRVRCLAAVEIDPRRAEELAAAFSGHDRVRVLCGDVRRRPFRDWLAAAGCGETAVLVANLPYNVATPILQNAIESPETILRAVATVQREVARRFVARPGDEAYGYLSVRVAARARCRILFDLPPGAFRPRPRVFSSVLELRPLEQPWDERLLRRALVLASLGFNARRKTLANALSPAGPRAQWEKALEAIGKDVRVRAEELGLEDFVALARGWSEG